MLTMRRSKGTKIFKPKKFVSPVNAVLSLPSLGEYEFILFRGKIVQRACNGFRFEKPNDTWSKIYKSPLKVIQALQS